MELYPYQEEAIESIYEFFRSNKTGNPLLALPTGTGKSVVIAFFIKQVMDQYVGQRILCVTHRKELIEQNYLEHIGIWPESPCGVYSASVKRKEHHYPITFCGIQSVAKKSHLFGRIDLVIIDEAHLVSPKDETMYQQFLNGLKLANPLVRVIGLTATCWRLNHGSLVANHIFTDICYNLTTINNFNKLIVEGYLAPVIPVRTEQFMDTDGVGTVAGEYNQKQLQEKYKGKDVNYRVLNEIVVKAANRKHWLIFATGIQHCEQIADILTNDFQISAAPVHSGLSRELVNQRIEEFKKGNIRALINMDLLTTGFNFRPIDFIGVMRPTKSSSLWVQMLGRGTRTADGKKDCLVADFARNTERLGPINDPVIPKAPGDKKEKGMIPIKICPKCDCYNHLSAAYCELCGEAFPRELVKLTDVASGLELIRKPIEPRIIKCYVKHMTFENHNKKGSPPSLKITYYCNQGATIFSQYLGFEHVQFVRKKAERIWERLVCLFFGEPIMYPKTIKEALQRTIELHQPQYIYVNVAPKYPEIIGLSYNNDDRFVLFDSCEDEHRAMMLKWEKDNLNVRSA